MHNEPFTLETNYRHKRKKQPVCATNPNTLQKKLIDDVDWEPDQTSLLEATALVLASAPFQPAPDPDLRRRIDNCASHFPINHPEHRLDFALRCEPFCRGCDDCEEGPETLLGDPVCWKCFKYRTDVPVLKYFPGGNVNEWLKAIGREHRCLILADGDGLARNYEHGRPTAGWRKLTLITELLELTVGDTMIAVSHQFHGENLIRVTSITQHPSRGFNYVYVTPEGEPWEREMFAWYWELSCQSEDGTVLDRSAGTEFWRAIRA
jgi:hypothetical protein